MENQKKKMMNLELLRCIAMMMVIVLHFLGKGKLLPDLSGEVHVTGYTAWMLESLSVVAVNVYMLISGYLLCESGFKWNRLVKLLLQIWTYSVLCGVIGLALGTTEKGFSVYFLLQLLFPVFMEHYWFMSAYVFLYFLLPFFVLAMKHMEQKQFLWLVLLFTGAFSVLKSILPVRLSLDNKGYDVLWFITVFFIAAYIRKYGISWLQGKAKTAGLYFLGVVLIFAGAVGIGMIYGKTGHFGTITGIFMEYNHIFCLLAALGLFSFFLQIEVKGVLAKIVGFAGPLTLGVYLLHENLGFRYTWPKWFGAEKVSNPAELLLYTCLAVLVVFTVGIFIEKLRNILMKPVYKLIDRICDRGRKN